jgi:hypothetical protein
MNLQQLRIYALDIAERYPQIKEDVLGIYDLTVMNIEDSDSVTHEIEMALRGIHKAIEISINGQDHDFI